MIPYTKHCFGKEEAEAVLEVIGNGPLVGGPRVEQFEDQFASYIGCRHAIAVNSGASALYLAIKTILPRPGEIILTSDLTYAATINSIILAGHRPVLADIDLTTFSMSDSLGILPRWMDPEEARIDAVVPVYFAGNPFYLGRRHPIVIEDAAHAMGTIVNGVRVGAKAISCFSFHPAKNMTVGMDGGMITCNDDWLAKELRLARLNGIERRGATEPQAMVTWGFKFNMGEIAAAIGMVQLRKVDALNEKRRMICDVYDKILSECPQIGRQKIWEGTISSRHIYPITVPNRKFTIEYLNKNGIGTAIHYRPIHRHPYFEGLLGYRKDQFPYASHVGDCGLSIPVHPEMTESEAIYIANSVVDSVRLAMEPKGGRDNE